MLENIFSKLFEDESFTDSIASWLPWKRWNEINSAFLIQQLMTKKKRLQLVAFYKCQVAEKQLKSTAFRA